MSLKFLFDEEIPKIIGDDTNDALDKANAQIVKIFDNLDTENCHGNVCKSDVLNAFKTWTGAVTIGIGRAKNANDAAVNAINDQCRSRDAIRNANGIFLYVIANEELTLRDTHDIIQAVYGENRIGEVLFSIVHNPDMADGEIEVTVIAGNAE